MIHWPNPSTHTGRLACCAMWLGSLLNGLGKRQGAVPPLPTTLTAIVKARLLPAAIIREGRPIILRGYMYRTKHRNGICHLSDYPFSTFHIKPHLTIHFPSISVCSQLPRSTAPLSVHKLPRSRCRKWQFITQCTQNLGEWWRDGSERTCLTPKTPSRTRCVRTHVHYIWHARIVVPFQWCAQILWEHLALHTSAHRVNWHLTADPRSQF